MDKQTQKELQNIVKKNYDEIALHYNETRKKHLSPLWDELIKIAAEVKDGDKIMDVGCGNGRLLEVFTNKKIVYLGVDASKKLIDCARELHPDRQFIVGDILELSQISEINFDYVFSMAVLHHIPSEELRIAALKQLKNKISPTGKIVITVWNFWSKTKTSQKKQWKKLITKFFFLKLIGKNQMEFGDFLFDWLNPQGQTVSKRYYHAFTFRQLKRITKKAGLKIENIFKDRDNYYLILKK